RAPLRVSLQGTGAKVEHAVVREQLSIANIEGFVVDQQANQLAVGDVDERLAGLRGAVLALGRSQRPQLVEAVEIGSRQAVGLAFVEVTADTDVTIRERKQGLRLRQHVQVQRGLVDRPRCDAEGRMLDHAVFKSAARSVTTTSAP